METKTILILLVVGVAVYSLANSESNSKLPSGLTKHPGKVSKPSPHTPYEPNMNMRRSRG